MRQVLLYYCVFSVHQAYYTVSFCVFSVHQAYIDACPTSGRARVHVGTYMCSSGQTAPFGCLHSQKEKR